MKLLFSQPVSDLLEPSVHIRMCYVEPLGIEYLAAAAERAGHESYIEYPVFSEAEILNTVEQERPDVLAVSIYSYAFPEAARWAQRVKAALPGVVLIAGGHHPTAEPEEVLKAGYDYVVIGEGEQSLLDLLAVIESGMNGLLPAGVAALRNGQIERGAERDRIRPLDRVPWPKRLHRVLADARNFQVINPPPSQQVNLAQVSYSRGCPNKCVFCSSAQMWRRQVAWRSPSNVLDEIEYLAETFGTNVVYFPDLELNVSPRRLHELCDEFQRRRPPVHWWGLFAVKGLDLSLLTHLYEAGCVKLSLGVEAVGNEALARLCSGKAPRWEQVLDVFQMAHDIGLITRVFLMIGNSEDTPEYYQELCDEIPYLAADDMRVSFTTPFPGTELFARATEDGLLAVTDLAQYTTEKPILRNPTMTPSDMLDWRERIIDTFYGNDLYSQRTSMRVRQTPGLARSYIEYFDRLLAAGCLREYARSKLRALVARIQQVESVAAFQT